MTQGVRVAEEALVWKVKIVSVFVQIVFETQGV
jgi:hypothetical protein